MLPVIWFAVVAVMVALYVVLDGFDLGAGIVHFGVGRTEAERRLVLRSIGPVWDGNEVWLLAAGGTLYFAFPALYASSFSGFYLPLMMVLWLLMLRGIAIEFRNQLDNALWRPAWDAVFCAASGLLVIFFGVALGNVVRGVPLSATGDFFLPLWTNLRPGPQPGVLDWYTVLVGIFAMLALTMHGSLWLFYKLEGEMQARAWSIARTSWMAVLAMTALVTWISFSIQPQLGKSYSERPLGLVFPALAGAALVAARVLMSKRHEAGAFLASCLYLIGMLTSVVHGVFPMVLPANSDPQMSLTIHNASAPEYGLRIGLMWFIPGALLASAYFFFLYRMFAGKVSAREDGH
jgi:cytochrome d ubiquinol oxidase subunit II